MCVVAVRGFNRSEPNLFYSRRIGRSPQGEANSEFVDRPQATTILGAAELFSASGDDVFLVKFSYRLGR